MTTLVAGTFTEDEMKRIRRGETVERVGIFNPTNGILVDGLIESPIGLLGNKLGLNWAGNDVKKMFIENPELMKNFIAHSQGSIRYKAAINLLYKIDKGKELLAYNLENSRLVGIAITPNMVKDLNSKFTFINLMKERLNEENKGKKSWKPLPYYMRNIGDWGSFIAAQGMPTNTNGHDNIGYNNTHYELDEGMYKRKIIKIIRNGKEEKIAVPNYNYKLGEMDGKDMRSIIERWEDKRTQEKWYGGK